jgi:hypothetical protein
MTTHRPAPLSGALSVVAAAVAVGLVAAAPAQRTALLVTAAGVGPLAVGLESRRRGRAAFGAVLVLLGVCVVGAGFALGLHRPARRTEVVELLPGLAGLCLLALGLGPLWAGRERLLASAGTGLVVVCVLVSGVVYGADAGTLLGAGVLAVLAWDLAEQAVNLGEQVGREARTAGVEVVHGGATLFVGGAGVVLARRIAAVDADGLPPVVLAGLLVAAFALAAALYN